MKRLLRKLHVCLLCVATLAWSATAIAQESATIPKAQASAAAAATPYAQASPSARPPDASQSRSLAKQGIEEIVVTAQKREESIQKVPISLTAIEGENLHFRGVEDLTDLQFQVPGLHYGNDTGAGQQVAIRGVSLTNADAFIEAPVATYVDGIYQVRSFRSPTLGLDLKRIEVLRGPQGTLFGRNATGGALNIVLEEPTDEFHGKFRTGVGSYGLAKVEGVASGPLIKGLLSGRLAGAFEHYGGDVENVYQFRITPKYINGSKNGTGRLALRLTPSESLTADFSLTGNKQTGGGVAPPIVSARIGTPADEAQGTIFPPTDPSLVIAHRPHRVKLNRNNDGDMENVSGAFKVVWDFGWASLKSITGFQQHGIFQRYDVDGTARDTFYFPNRKDLTTAPSEEVNLLGTTPWFSWLVGTYYMNENYQGIFDPILLPDFAGGAGLVVGLRAREKIDSVAFFGDGTVPLPKGFKLFGGLRFTHDAKTLTQTVTTFVGGGFGGLIPVIPVDLPSGTCTNLTLKDSFNNVSPRYGIQWDASEDINIYAKQSFGYNAGGHNSTTCNNLYKAETLDTIETGVKSQWFGERLVANVALYRNIFKNFQILKAVLVGNSPTAVTEVVNAPEARMFGAEFELAARPVEQLTLSAAIALMHSYYVHFEDIDDRNPRGPFENLSGRQLSNAPNYTLSFGAEYAWPIPDWFRTGSDSDQWLANARTPNTFRLRGEWYHTDYILFRPFGHREDNRQKNFSILNLFATVASRNDNLEFRVFGKNLTDAQYFGFIASAQAFSLGVPGGPPRTFGAELTLKF